VNHCIDYLWPYGEVPAAKRFVDEAPFPYHVLMVANELAVMLTLGTKLPTPRSLVSVVAPEESVAYTSKPVSPVAVPLVVRSDLVIYSI